MPLIELSAMVGRQRVAWRYDPVLLTQTYTVTRHLETFARMARVLAPHVDRCIFSFVEMYRKLQVNMPELIPLSTQDMDTLARGLGEIARAHGMPIQTCGTNGTAFLILRIDADIADVRVRQCHNLSRIARVGHNFLIACHGRIEYHFGRHASRRTESATEKDFAVGKHEGCLRTRICDNQTQGSSLSMFLN